jgi:hypothetical protein
MSELRNDFHLFIQENTAFLLSFFGLLGGCCSYLLVFALKSRCTSVKCCGFEVSRIPIPIEQLNNINLELGNNNNNNNVAN